MPTTVAEDVKQILQEVGRPILEELGFRPNGLTVQVVQSTIDETTSAETFTVVSALTITPRPRIREVGLQEVNESGGRYQVGDLRVDKITPEYPGPPAGGYTLAQIAPDLPDFGGLPAGQSVRYVVAGPLAGEYARFDFDRDRALGWAIMLRRTRSTP